MLHRYLLRALAAAALTAAVALLVLRAPGADADAAPQVVPAPALDLPAAGERQVATLSGGCFWGIQGVFEHVRGVERAVSGYAGGSADSADYDTVSSGKTGHAETVQITYDPRQISFGRILQIFFSVALDPTEVDHQGPDWGPQYRSEILGGGCRSGACSARLFGAARGGARLAAADRDAGGGVHRLLSGRGLSPGLSPSPSPPALYRL